MDFVSVVWHLMDFEVKKLFLVKLYSFSVSAAIELSNKILLLQSNFRTKKIWTSGRLEIEIIKLKYELAVRSTLAQSNLIWRDIDISNRLIRCDFSWKSNSWKWKSWKFLKIFVVFKNHVKRFCVIPLDCYWAIKCRLVDCEFYFQKFVEFDTDIIYPQCA